jgi:hypothetical protein
LIACFWFNCVLRDDEVGRKTQFDFVRFVTVAESNDGLGTSKLMRTPNVSKMYVDNGNGKRFGAFFISTAFLLNVTNDGRTAIEGSRKRLKHPQRLHRQTPTMQQPKIIRTFSRKQQ